MGSNGVEETMPQRAGDAPVDPIIGAHLGEYVVHDALGEGGMGLVYRGEQPVIGKPVAIKVLRWEVARNPDEARRLLTEARSVNAIRHRGIIDIFSFGQLPDGRHYFVMELLEGSPLDRVIADRAPMEPASVLPILDEVLDALAAAHGAGVIHRDLKPNNVFLVTPPHGTPYVKLLDFGLAKQAPEGASVTPQTRRDLVIGTPYYMAPEQARSLSVGPMTDIYAVGCMAFEMLSGRRPYEAATPYEVVTMHLNAELPVLSTQVPDIPSELSTVVARMMARRAEDRPQSARLLRRELQRIQAHLPEEKTQVRARMPARPPSAAVDSLSCGPTMVRGAAQISAVPSATPVGRVDAAQPAVSLEATRRTPRRRWPVALASSVAIALAAALTVAASRTESPAEQSAPSDEGALLPPDPPPPLGARSQPSESESTPAQGQPPVPAPPAAVSTAPVAAPTVAAAAPPLAEPKRPPGAEKPGAAAPPAHPPGRARQTGNRGDGSEADRALTARIERQLASMKARQAAGKEVDSLALQLLGSIKTGAARARTRAEWAVVAKDMAAWELRYGR